MRVKLEDIADIRTGYTFRGALEESPEGDIRVLQIKDMRQRSRLDPLTLPRVVWEARGEPPLLQPKDIVVVARGESNTAALFPGGEAVVPSNQLLVVSAKRRNVLPEFLCWLLNQEVVHRQLIEARTGTNIASIGKSDLSGLDLSLPSLETQQKVLRLQGLWDEEQRLLDDLKKNRETMLKGMFRQLLEQ